MSGVKYSKVKYFLSFIISLCFYGIVSSISVSASSVEIKMDLSYKYKKDDFKVIYTDDNNNEYDVTRKSELNIEEIDTGSGIVRKATANYEGLSDVVYEYTVNYDEAHDFSAVYENMKLVNTYLVKNGDKRVMDILNIKIENRVYYGEQYMAYYRAGNSVDNVSREINYIGCNSDNSDYDMPIFDGEGTLNYFFHVRIGRTDNNNDDRRVNLYNFQVQNYWNGIFYREHYNGTIKGLVLKDIYTPEGASSCMLNNSDCKTVAGIETITASNNLFEDNEFIGIIGSTVAHTIYMYNNSNGNVLKNNFFINSDVNTVKMRRANNNNKFINNYFSDATNYYDKESGGSGVGYIADVPQGDEETGYGNEFCGNLIRNSDPGHLPRVVSIYDPADYSGTFRFSFDGDGNCENCQLSKDFRFSQSGAFYNAAPGTVSDFDTLIKVNSCTEPNKSSVGGEPFTPTRNIIKHIDKSGNTLSPNDVIIVNGGENFIAAPRKNLVGVSGDNIYTKEYSVRLYDENNNLITTDINGNRISDENGYINNYTEISLNSLLKNNQTLKFVYSEPEILEPQEIPIPKVPDAGRAY